VTSYFTPPLWDGSYPHTNSRVYNRAMTTPILTAAAARQSRRNPRAAGGRGGKISSHNYIAEGGKKPAGAPLGNRNAARRSQEYVDRQARLTALVQQTKALADAAFAAVDRAHIERQALAALLAEPRDV
jgi:hypothetical protein